MNPRGDYPMPLFGADNTDIPGFATTNTISRYTGEPISNQHLAGRVSAETKSGLIRDVHFEEPDVESRFSSIDTTETRENKFRENNVIGGNLTREGQERQRKAEEKRERGEGPPQGEQNLGGRIGTGGVPAWNEISTESENARTIDNSYERLNPDMKRDVKPPSGFKGNVKLGSGKSQGFDLSTGLVGGPNPETKLSGALGRHDIPYDITNQMYYAEDTGNVKSTEKLGQAKDGGQGAMESVTLGGTVSDKRVPTENEREARKNAPHEPVGKDYPETTYI